MQFACSLRSLSGKFLLLSLLSVTLHAQLVVTRTPAPNRGGAKDRNCPPNWNGATGGKSPLDPAKGDVNAGADMRYYMGETKLVLTQADGSTTNLIMRRWCVSTDPTDNGVGADPRFTPGDYFTNEIVTSKNGVETQRIAPGPNSICCPFVGGRNLSSGLEAATIEKLKTDRKLPTRLDWISGNPKDNRRNRPDDDYEKTIFEIKDDQTVVLGKIVRQKNGMLRFSGTFRTAGGFKAAADLTDADKDALKKDLDQERSNVMSTYPGVLASLFPTPANLIKFENDEDVDDDGIPNGQDNCVVVANPDQTDSLGNGLGDACRSILPCDTDGNNSIDIFDISNIIVARGLPAAQFQLDPRDVDGDGTITVNDARICSQRCSRSDCQPPQ